MKKLFIYLSFFMLLACKNNDRGNFKKLEGHALGTTFHITYQEALVISEKQIDSLIYLVNKSMSTYMPNSDISKINKGDTTVIIDDMFLEVFNKSDKVYQETDGVFDPTVGILVNAWGFGPEEELNDLSRKQIDSLLIFVGFDNLKVKNYKIYKKYPQMYLDFNANAKGYAVDVIGRFLELKNIDNYLVELGGEIKARGLNSKNKLWKIAIEKPNFDGSRSFQTEVELNNESIATSGSYRKFKIDNKTGEKYAHTMNARTGYPSKNNLLSASVISKLDCADVDAYATAFMAMGFDKSKLFLKKHDELKAFLIYSDEKGEIKTFTTRNLEASNY
ncbi:MAG: FAD:protein FMN transferase [Flavobacteriaceae bacterium]|nr:FAD:protein FMN transferase [Flavobacteriaceae bacterium]